MNRIETLAQKVKDLYLAQHPNRDEWADWLYEHHVLVVADYAKDIAGQKGADVELSEVAALLHDIADAKMKRAAPDHEAQSLRMAHELMKSSGYSDAEMSLIVDDAIKHHSCHGGKRPESLEGQVLATADALAHLKTDFYLFALWITPRDKMSLEQLKDWTLKKIDRDLTYKICFDDIREDARKDYEIIQTLFSR